MRTLHGLRVEVAASDVELLRAALEELPESAAASTSHRLSWSLERGAPDREPRPALIPGSHGLSFCCEPGRVELGTCAGSRCAIDLRAGSARVSIAPEAPVKRDVAALLGMAMPFLCRECELYPVHAAAVGVGERTLLLAGPSGSGKSTTAALLAAQGLELRADDLVLLAPDDPVPRILGVRRAPRLDAGALARLDTCARAPSFLHGRPDPVLLFSMIVGTTGCRLEAVSPVEALARLVDCSLLLGEREPTAAHLAALARLAETAVSFRLLLGQSTASLFEQIRRALH